MSDNKKVKIAGEELIVNGRIKDKDDTGTPKSIYTPVKATEVYQKLRNNKWLQMDRGLYWSDNGIDFSINYTDPSDNAEIDTVDLSAPTVLYHGKRSERGERGGTNIMPDDVKDMVDTLYETTFGGIDLMPDKIKNTLPSKKSYMSGFYEGGRQFFDLLPADSYINRIPLNKIIEYTRIPGISGKFSIVIRYGDQEYFIPSRVKLFWYTSEDGELMMYDDYKEDNGDVIVFLDPEKRILECRPLEGKDISECIFDSCIVDYGKQQ